MLTQIDILKSIGNGSGHFVETAANTTQYTL